MTALSIVQRAAARARWHTVAGVALAATPWLLAGAALAWRMQLGAWAWLALAMAMIAVVAYAGWHMRAMDADWIARSLDARRPDMEDSAALLLQPEVSDADATGSGHSSNRQVSALTALQRRRLQQRIENGATPDLREPWPIRALWVSGLLALAVAAASWWWPGAAGDAVTARESAKATAAQAAQPRLVAQRLEIHPPAYTGLPQRGQDKLSARVPVGSMLHWTLRFSADPSDIALVFHDGSRVPLQRGGDGTWTATHRSQRASLYHVEYGATSSATRRTTQRENHRIEVIGDRPPQVRLLQPARTLDTVTSGQRSWSVSFEARDDYGLAADARLRITRTEGSGENITANERMLSLRGSGSGNATLRRYTHRFDLAALGLVPGDDLIVQLIVSDRRTPQPQQVKGPSVILRWPPEKLEQATGLDGLARKVMPAYFRSQRQIIIDAEALLKEKPRLSADRFAQKSDAIGVDQRLLRLRYGQFLGEESEGAPQAPLPTSDAPAQPAQESSLPVDEPPATRSDLPIDEPPARAAHGDHPDESSVDESDVVDRQADDAQPHSADDGHDHAQDAEQSRAAVFGEEVQVLERFGHTHDIPEAATLLDPKTRELLRAALDQMWSSELQLRTARPDRALPFAYRALDLIKKVQQSERIYLAKVGTELAPIDLSRRLGGKRDGLSDRDDPIRATPATDPVIAEAWAALAPVPADTAATSRNAARDAAAAGSKIADANAADATMLDLTALDRWLASHDASGSDVLEIAAARQALQRDPACLACRARLRALLWPLLHRPPSIPAARRGGGRAGDAYLDALQNDASQSQEPAR